MTTQASIDVRRDTGRPGGPVVVVTVDDHRRLNCLGSAQIARLERVFLELSADPALRAVVLTGAGERAFIGGADLRELGRLDRHGARSFITALHHACRAIRSCPVPVIARLNGFALGAGLEVAVSCGGE